MTYSISICPGGPPAKNALGYATLQKHFGGLVHVGGIGRYFEFEKTPGAAGETMEAAYMLYGIKGLIGRGFYLYIEKGYARFEVSAALPTTVHDLEDMFTFAGMLASLVGAKEVQDSFGSYPRAMLPSLYPDVLKNNLNLLKTHAINQPGFVVSAVRFPMMIPAAVCERIGRVPPINAERFLAAYLDDKQRLKSEYLKPTFFKSEEGTPQALYELNEGVSYIVPQSPAVPYGPPPFEGETIASWQVALVSAQLGPLGTLPYEAFVARLAETEQRPFDDAHFIVNALSQRRLQEILEGN